MSVLVSLSGGLLVSVDPRLCDLHLHGSGASAPGSSCHFPLTVASKGWPNRGGRSTILGTIQQMLWGSDISIYLYLYIFLHLPISIYPYLDILIFLRIRIVFQARSHLGGFVGPDSSSEWKSFPDLYTVLGDNRI